MCLVMLVVCQVAWCRDRWSLVRDGAIAMVATSRFLSQTEEDRRREHAQSGERRETRG